MSKISFIHSADRYYNVSRSLSLIKSEIVGKLKNAKSVVVKVSCPLPDYQLISSHVDALAATLDFITPHSRNQVILGAGTERGKTLDAMLNYHYFDIQDKYGFSITDLNNDEMVDLGISDSEASTTRVLIPRTLHDSDCIISLCPPKSDNNLIFDGSITNITSVSLPVSLNSLTHRLIQKIKYPSKSDNSMAINYKKNSKRLSLLYKKLNVALSIIDGFSTVQFKSSINSSQMIASHWAIASTSPFCADTLSCQLIGIDPENIAYLSILDEGIDQKDIFVTGDDWHKFIIQIKKPENYYQLIKWRQ